MLLVISIVLAWEIMQSVLSGTKFSISSNIFSNNLPENFWDHLIISWEPLFTYSVKKAITRCNNFFVLFILTICPSFLGRSESVLSLKRFLFTLLLSWRWLCREFQETVKVLTFFNDNWSVKKLIILFLFKIFFSYWEFLSSLRCSDLSH